MSDVKVGGFYGRHSGKLKIIAQVLREYQPSADPKAARMTYFWETHYHPDGRPPFHGLTPSYMTTREFEQNFRRLNMVDAMDSNPQYSGDDL